MLNKLAMLKKETAILETAILETAILETGGKLHGDSLPQVILNTV
ncbi:MULTISPECIES: hypothetical protein [Okeania]|nr:MULTISPECIES: hypothetical protein [Okeania]